MLRNQVQLIGRLVKAPEVNHFESGKVKAVLSLATNGFYVDDKGDRSEDTQHHTVVVWGNNAKVAEKYLDKGSELAISGRLVYRSEVSPGTLIKRTYAEVVANELVLLGKTAPN